MCSCYLGFDVGMEIKVKEQQEDAQAVEDEGPLHPDRVFTADDEGQSSMKHAGQELHLHQPRGTL